MTFTIAESVLLGSTPDPEARLLIKTAQGEFLCQPSMGGIEVILDSWTPMMHEYAEKLCTHLVDSGYGRGKVKVNLAGVRAKVLDCKPYACVVGRPLSVDLLHAPWKRSIGVVRLGLISEFKIV
ncbi:MAG TPA: hypothetical protein VLG09_05085 [Candidatus Saccharimonadales bacterium]|nr:hypothetical protein [Candidatus Saccharimonadales bacterium]